MKRILCTILVAVLCLGLIPTALASRIEHTHEWRETSRTESTCTKSGSATYICYCGETKTEKLKKAGHKWGAWKTTREATCTVKGEETRKCKVCGKKETREVDKAHAWGEWTVTVEPADFTMGTRAHACQVCGAEESEDFYPDPTYKKGDKGEGVKDLQEKLNAAGYNCGAVDGDFGKKTEAAVKALEEAHGFAADGIAWPGVQKWLSGGADDAGDAASTQETEAVALELTVTLASEERETYAIGDEVSFDWTLTNRGGADLTFDRLFMTWGGEGTVCVCQTPMALTANGGSMLMDTWTVALDAEWLNDGAWNLSFFGQGYAGGGADQGQYTASNSVSFRLEAAVSDWGDSLDSVGGSLLAGGNSNPAAPPSYGTEVYGEEPIFRALEIVKQSKNDDDYYDGAKIPVQLRLTIDSYDNYRLISVSRDPGDSIEIGDWTEETLEAGQSYEFTYWMALDPSQTGWKTRNVTVRLKSLTFDSVEEESCEVRPPFTLPNVRIVGGNDSVIDYPAFLYLAAGVTELSGYPTEGVDIPVTVSTDAADEFDNVKLVIQENWMGNCFHSTIVSLAKKMKGHETVDFIPHWAIQALENTWKDYTLTLYVVGNTYDKNNKVQTIESLPITIALNVQDPDKEAGTLELTYTISPSTNPIWSKSEVRLDFKIRNTGRDPVENVYVEYGDAYKWLEKVLGSIAVPYDGGLLEPDMTAHASLTFKIPDRFVEEKEMDITFTARGALQKDGRAVRSKNIWIVRGIDSKIPKTGLSLSASVKDAKSAYPAGGQQTCVLTLRNDSDKMLRKLRIYAVGDNRGEDRASGTPWLDLGHGAKGWLWTERHIDLEPGKSAQFEAPTTISSGFTGPGDYRPGWIVDAELDDRSPVRSNPATVSLPVLMDGGDAPSDGDIQLKASVISDLPEDGDWHDGDVIKVKFDAAYTGAETPAKIRVEAGPLQSDVPMTTAAGSNVIEYIDDIEFKLDAGYAIDGVCYYTLTASAYLPGDEEADAVSEPFLLSFPIVNVATEPEEAVQVELDVNASAPTSEDGVWHDGDKAHVQFSANYIGEETPVELKVCVYDASMSYLADYSRLASDSNSLSDEYDITLNADAAVDGHIVMNYIARVCLTDASNPDCESKTIPLVFSMEPGGIENKINWDAINNAAGGADGTMPEGTDGTMPEATDGTMPEATDGTMPDGTDGTMPEGTDGTMPESTDGTMPESTDGTMPEGTDGIMPDGTDGSMPEVTDGTMPEGTDGTMPEGTDGTMPEATDGSMPEGTDGTKPEATDGSMPEGTDGTMPDGTDGTMPDGTDGTMPVDKYEEFVVTIPGAAYDIPATVCLPGGEGPFPAVVMLHGTGSTRDEAGDGYKVAAPVLAQRYGIATIRIDFPGNGDSTADYMLYNFHSAVADAKAAADYMASLDRVDGDAIGVMGWSQGGTDALLACAWEPETFKSVVTWAGAPNMMLDGFFTQEDYEEAKENGYFAMEFDWRDDLNVSLQWCDDVANTDVLGEFARGYSGPVLAIAGTNDDTIDPAWSQRIVEASGNERSGVCFIDGMDHTFNVFTEADLHALYVAIDATGGFFAETLR